MGVPPRSNWFFEETGFGLEVAEAESSGVAVRVSGGSGVEVGAIRVGVTVGSSEVGALSIEAVPARSNVATTACSCEVKVIVLHPTSISNATLIMGNHR
jgi:hypothetical protein